jgi:hypothetical protein
MFYVRFARVTTLLAAPEIAPAAEADAHLWPRRQVERLRPWPIVVRSWSDFMRLAHARGVAAAEHDADDHEFRETAR